MVIFQTTKTMDFLPLDTAHALYGMFVCICMYIFVDMHLSSLCRCILYMQCYLFLILSFIWVLASTCLRLRGYLSNSKNILSVTICSSSNPTFAHFTLVPDVLLCCLCSTCREVYVIIYSMVAVLQYMTLCSCSTCIHPPPHPIG